MYEAPNYVEDSKSNYLQQWNLSLFLYSMEHDQISEETATWVS